MWTRVGVVDITAAGIILERLRLPRLKLCNPELESLTLLGLNHTEPETKHNNILMTVRVSHLAILTCCLSHTMQRTYAKRLRG